MPQCCLSIPTSVRKADTSTFWPWSSLLRIAFIEEGVGASNQWRLFCFRLAIERELGSYIRQSIIEDCQLTGIMKLVY